MKKSIYKITTTDEYSKEEKSFERIFPARFSLMEVFEILDAELNTVNRANHCPVLEITIEKHDYYDYPVGHWYRDQCINPSLQS